VILSAGQHANETSGVIGILRAARELDQRAGSHFALIPLMNPDGYALHQRLTAVNPFHMHHAARYTALGDDLTARPEPMLERAALVEAWHISGAELHINLHGYPAHEWLRPWSGYLPRGFDAWTIPKGFFLILRHRAAWQAQAERLLARVTEHLAAIPELIEFNRRQHSSFETYAGPSALSPWIVRTTLGLWAASAHGKAVKPLGKMNFDAGRSLDRKNLRYRLSANHPSATTL